MYMFVCGYAQYAGRCVYMCCVSSPEVSCLLLLSTHFLRQGLFMNLGAYLARVPGK